MPGPRAQLVFAVYYSGCYVLIMATTLLLKVRATVYVFRVPCAVVRGSCSVFRGSWFVVRVLCSMFRVRGSCFRIPCSLFYVLCSMVRGSCFVLRFVRARSPLGTVPVTQAVDARAVSFVRREAVVSSPAGCFSLSLSLSPRARRLVRGSSRLGSPRFVARAASLALSSRPAPEMFPEVPAFVNALLGAVLTCVGDGIVSTGSPWKQHMSRALLAVSCNISVLRLGRRAPQSPSPPPPPLPPP